VPRGALVAKNAIAFGAQANSCPAVDDKLSDGDVWSWRR
jgi:hypothetical protein